MSKVFGGSKSKQQSSSESFNRNDALIKDTFSPLTNIGTSAAGSLQALLGGDSTGFDNYKSATGFDFVGEQGGRGILANRAAKGLLNSGGTQKDLVEYGNNLQQTFAGNYMDKLLGLTSAGTSAGGLIAGTGNYSKSSGTSKSSSKPGLGGFLGGIMASDRRAKTNIKLVGETSEGLGVYEFEYIWDKGQTRTGVMADEVAKVKPEALGPVIGGYQTVDYNKLELT